MVEAIVKKITEDIKKIPGVVGFRSSDEITTTEV